MSSDLTKQLISYEYVILFIFGVFSFVSS